MALLIMLPLAAAFGQQRETRERGERGERGREGRALEMMLPDLTEDQKEKIMANGG